MTGVLVVTHGRLADELLYTVSELVGPPPYVQAIGLGPDDDIDEIRQRMAAAVDELNDGDGVLILADMFAATPSNLAVSLMNSGTVEVVAGVNLPMLLRAIAGRGTMRLSEFASEVGSIARRGVRDTLSKPEPPEGAPSIGMDSAELSRLAFSLDQCISDLQMLSSLLKSLASHAALAPGIGHNSVSEIDGSVPAIIEEALLATSILQRELRFNAPQPDAVSLAHRLLSRLLTALRSMAGWAAKKGDKFVDGVVESVSKAAGTALIIGIVVTSLETHVTSALPQLTEILKQLLEKLG